MSFDNNREWLEELKRFNNNNKLDETSTNHDRQLDKEAAFWRQVERLAVSNLSSEDKEKLISQLLFEFDLTNIDEKTAMMMADREKSR